MRHSFVPGVLSVFAVITNSHDVAAWNLPTGSLKKQQNKISTEELVSELDKSRSLNRRAFGRLLLGPSLAALVTGIAPEKSHADERLFRPNPLTNPFLEQIRIWEQAEADELRYGGELEMGDAGNKGKVSAYPRLLVPILVIANDLENVQRLLSGNDSLPDQEKLEVWQRVGNIIQQSKYDKIAFKKAFNAYGDNIYYSDPDRANLYLGGGATPRTEQSLAYLLRNEILTTIEDLRAELDYLRRNPTESSEDLVELATSANKAMRRYITEVVPPGELELAREQLQG